MAPMCTICGKDSGFEMYGVVMKHQTWNNNEVCEAEFLQWNYKSRSWWKFPVFYEIWSIIAVFTTVRYWSLSGTRRIQYTPSYLSV